MSRRGRWVECTARSSAEWQGTTLEENTGELQEYVNEKSMNEVDSKAVIPKKITLRRRNRDGVRK